MSKKRKNQGVPRRSSKKIKAPVRSWETNFLSLAYNGPGSFRLSPVTLFLGRHYSLFARLKLAALLIFASYCLYIDSFITFLWLPAVMFPLLYHDKIWSYIKWVYWALKVYVFQRDFYEQRRYLYDNKSLVNYFLQNPTGKEYTSPFKYTKGIKGTVVIWEETRRHAGAKFNRLKTSIADFNTNPKEYIRP